MDPIYLLNGYFQSYWELLIAACYYKDNIFQFQPKILPKVITLNVLNVMAIVNNDQFKKELLASGSHMGYECRFMLTLTSRFLSMPVFSRLAPNQQPIRRRHFIYSHHSILPMTGEQRGDERRSGHNTIHLEVVTVRAETDLMERRWHADAVLL